jgi:HEAT repeat protein
VVVAESARTLGTFGARAAPAIPHLEQQLAHPDPVVRATVQQALEKIRGP